MEITTHLIARGISIQNGKILLAHHIEANYDFLPGGHVEPGESTQTALERECDEEFGAVAHAGELVTIFEHRWDNKHETQHEINAIFSLTLTGDMEAPISKVSHLTFHWVPIDELGMNRFLPSELLPAMHDYLNGKEVPHLISTIR